MRERPVQHGGNPFTAIRFIAGIHGFGYAVGEQEQRFSRRQLHTAGQIGEIVHHAKRRTAIAVKPHDETGCIEAPGRVMARIHQVHSAAFHIHHPGYQGNEELLRIFAGHFGVRHADDRPDADVATQCRTFRKRLGHHHEQAGGQPLSGDVSDDKKQAAFVDHKKIIEIATYLACRLQHGRNFEPSLVGEGGVRSRQGPHLDAPRCLQLTVELSRFDSLDLQPAHSAFSLMLVLNRGTEKQAAQDSSQRSRQVDSIEQQSAPMKEREPRNKYERHQPKQDQRKSSGFDSSVAAGASAFVRGSGRPDGGALRSPDI